MIKSDAIFCNFTAFFLCQQLKRFFLLIFYPILFLSLSLVSIPQQRRIDKNYRHFSLFSHTLSGAKLQLTSVLFESHKQINITVHQDGLLIIDGIASIVGVLSQQNVFQLGIIKIRFEKFRCNSLFLFNV